MSAIISFTYKKKEENHTSSYYLHTLLFSSLTSHFIYFFLPFPLNGLSPSARSSGTFLSLYIPSARFKLLDRLLLVFTKQFAYFVFFGIQLFES